MKIRAVPLEPSELDQQQRVTFQWRAPWLCSLEAITLLPGVAWMLESITIDGAEQLVMPAPLALVFPIPDGMPALMLKPAAVLRFTARPFEQQLAAGQLVASAIGVGV